MIEICIDSVESAINAEKGGAKRLELCSNLVEGGTTPTVGMLKIIKQCVKLPVFVMIRPRGGDFCYTEQEFEVMKCDIEVMKEYGADGIVTGVLQSDGTVDADKNIELIDLAKPLSVTFHRAIDMTPNMEQALETIISLGCERVLTSGGENTALEGSPIIRKLIEIADQRIIVMPGGGITERNLRRILDETGAREFHCSARTSCDSAMEYRNSSIHMGATYGPQEYLLKLTSSERVKTMIRIANQQM